MQGKMEAARERDEAAHPQRTLKGRRDRPATLTRFDEGALSKEQQEVEEQLSRSQEMRSKWKKAADKSKNEVGRSSFIGSYWVLGCLQPFGWSV